MVEMTPEQAALVAAILTFFPLLFQYLQLGAAHPWVAPKLARLSTWIRIRVKISSDNLKRIFVLSLALTVLFLTNIPVFPAFPPGAEFTSAYMILVLTWATNAVLSLMAYQRWLHLMYKHLWSKIFGGDLATDNIRSLAARNIAKDPPQT